MRSSAILAICCLSLMPAARAAGPNDGTYRGVLQLTRGETPPCGRNPAPRMMTITNNRLSYTHFGDLSFTPEISPDGSFSRVRSLQHRRTWWECEANRSGRRRAHRSGCRRPAVHLPHNCDEGLMRCTDHAALAT